MKPFRTRRGKKRPPNQTIIISNSENDTELLDLISNEIGGHNIEANNEESSKTNSPQPCLASEPSCSSGISSSSPTPSAREAPGTTGVVLAEGGSSNKPPATPAAKVKRRQFTVDFKLEVVDQAKKSNKVRAAK